MKMKNCSSLHDGQQVAPMFFDIWLMFYFNFEFLSVQGIDATCDQDTVDTEERKTSFANDTTNKNSFSSASSEKSPKVADNYEPIDIEGQKETGVWVHHPGSEVSQTWEPRKGRNRRLDTEIQKEPNDLVGSCNSTASCSLYSDCSSPDDNPEDKNRMKSVRRGLHKIGSVFRRNHKREDQLGSVGEEVPSPHDNIQSVNAKGIGVKFVMEDNISGFPTGKVQAEAGSTEGSGPESPGKGNVKDMAKNIFKHAGKSARGLKHALSGKSRKSKAEAPAVPERIASGESDSSDDEPLPVQSPTDERIQVVSHAMDSSNNGPPKPKVIMVQTVPSNITVDNGAPVKNENLEADPEKVRSPVRSGEEFVKSVEPKRDKEEMAADKREISLAD